MQRIAIAGAGIGGLAAALALDDPGRQITVFERAPALSEAGAGLQLSPNACAALRSLGVLAEVEADAVALDAVRIGRGRDGALLARLPLGETARRRFGAPFLVTQRADLHRALLRRVQSSPRVAVVTGASLAGWRRGPGTLRLRFAEPAIAAHDAEALIGADGVHSTVRAVLAGGSEPAARQRGTAWRSTIEAARVPPPFREPCSNLWLGHGLHLVHYPVARGRLINVVAALDGPSDAAPPGAGWTRPGDPAEIAACFAGWAEPIRRLIGAAERWSTWPLLDRPPLRDWSAGRVTLMGDAAHPMLPFLAQGAAQALEDAVALGHAVRAKPDDLDAAFRSYASHRGRHAGRVQTTSRRQATIYHLPAPASTLRDMVLRVTPGGRLLSRYDWLYAPAPAAALPAAAD